VWTQIKADITGKRIVVPASDTATTWGAALLAGVGVGLYPDFARAVDATIAVRREHAPDAGSAVAYQRGYDTYRALYGRLRDLMRDSTREGETL
jgi:xylulokinase